MRGHIATPAAGIILGGTGTAVAGEATIWHNAQGPYSCAGNSEFVACGMRGTGWAMYINRTTGKEDFLGIYRNRKVIFACKRTAVPATCDDFR